MWVDAHTQTTHTYTHVDFRHIFCGIYLTLCFSRLCKFQSALWRYMVSIWHNYTGKTAPGNCGLCGFEQAGHSNLICVCCVCVNQFLSQIFVVFWQDVDVFRQHLFVCTLDIVEFLCVFFYPTCAYTDAFTFLSPARSVLNSEWAFRRQPRDQWGIFPSASAAGNAINHWRLWNPQLRHSTALSLCPYLL